MSTSPSSIINVTNQQNSSDTIETLFFKATSPIHKSADPNLMNYFCSKVNSDPEGHHLAIRLISHKIQSPQEHEALRTLELLEVCVQSCGRRFHQEIGKFRFLNEMIKLVSPKYLANHTSEKIKKKVIEILYSWTQTLPSEVKINEAYQMLKRQSIITEDPMNLNRNSMTPIPQRTKSIFDQDEEKSKTLQRLLKSRKPEDLEQANALIKSLVKKDEEKIEKLSHRANELEKIHNNIRVLSEMLIQYNSSTVSEAEKETMIYLHEELEKFRPILFRLATESEDDDEGLGEILSTSDSLSRVLSQYDRLVKQDHLNKDDLVLPIFDDVLPLATNPMNSSNLLIDLPTETKPTDSTMVKSTINEFDDLFGTIQIKSNDQSNSSMNTNEISSTIQSTRNSSIDPNSRKTNENSNEGSKKKITLFEDLKDLLVDHSTGIKLSSASSTTTTKSSFQSSVKVPLNDLIDQRKQSLTRISSNDQRNSDDDEFPSINIQSIRPSLKYRSIQFELKHSTGLQCILHFARESTRSDLIPMVLSITNTNTEYSIEQFRFQAFVSKNIRIKIEDPSSTNLPVYNPIFPAQSITQIILLLNPKKESIEFGYKIQYLQGDRQIVVSGFLDQGFPISFENE